MRKVAVVAVHGIADQAEGSSALAMVDLLSRVRTAEGEAAYGAFAARDLLVPLRAYRSRSAKRVRGTAAAERDGADASEEFDPNVELTRALIAGHDAGGAWATRRHEGETRDTRGENVGVHVYELHWADLSRAPESWTRLLRELYQLVLHLPSLGRSALAFDFRREPRAPFGFRAYEWARVSCTTVLPMLNYALLMMVLLPFPAWAASRWPKATGAVLLTGLLAALGGVAGALAYRAARGWVWPALVVAAVAVTAPVVSVPPAWLPAIATGVYLAGFVGLGLFASAWWSQRADRVPAWSIAILLGSGMAAVAALYLERAGARHIVGVGVAMAQLGSKALELGWGVTLLLMVVAYLALVVGWFRRGGDARTRRRSLRAIVTACLTLSVSNALFAAITTPIFAGLALSLAGLLGNRCHTLMPGVSCVSKRCGPEACTAGELAEALAVGGHGDAAMLPILALVAAALVGLLVVLPAVVREVAPRPDTRDSTTRHGLWLDRGRAAFLVAAIIVIGTAPLLSLVAGVLGLDVVDGGFVHRMFVFGGSGSLVGALAVGSRFASIAKAARPVVDAVLDIDNYMRERPIGENPRARIVARYASLMHALRIEGYDEIVIVAHSQGTVVTTDFLRMCRADGNDVGAIRLFTMGSPLRQLYAWRFPEAYGWVTRPGGPSVDDLGVKEWVHAFRSGDYVGRAIWGHRRSWGEWQDSAPAPSWARRTEVRGGVADRPGVAEFCLGGGAHTHYWDETAPAVATEVDRLVCG